MDIVISGEVQGIPAVSSKLVAEKFGKRHTEVIRAYKSIKEELQDTEFIGRNFASKEIKVLRGGGTEIKEIQMTRDGFALLAMGFTGQDALLWKVRFINAFNEMARIAMLHAENAIYWRNEAQRLSKLVPKTKAIDSPRRSNNFMCPFLKLTLSNQVEIVWDKAKKEEVEEWQWAMAMAHHAAKIKKALIERCDRIIEECVRIVMSKFKPSELADERDAVMAQVSTLLSHRVLIK